MKRFTLSFLIVSAFLIVLLGSNVATAQNVNVTFQVNMKIQLQKAAFLPASGDSVFLRGNITGWDAAGDSAMTDLNGDSIYTITVSLPQNTVCSYKFFKTLPRTTVDWESNLDGPVDGGPNRAYTIGTTDVTLPVWWFNAESVYTPIVNVTFQVNMRVKILEGTFRPDLGDIVRIAGGFDSWGSSTDTLTDDNNDSIYTKTLPLSGNIQYKFLKTPRAGVDWENNVDQASSGGNRSFDCGFSDVSIPVKFFDADSVVNITTSGNVSFAVDMTTIVAAGWFDHTKDTMRVRGGVNGWSNGDGSLSLLDRTPGTEYYSLSAPFSSWPFEDYQYFKYYMQHDTTGGIENRFAGYSNDADGVEYEHPADFGDGNREHYVSTLGDQETPAYYFDGVHPSGGIAAGDTVTVTLQYDMAPAVAYADAFVPGADTVFLHFENRPWHIKLGYPRENSGIILTDPDGDGIYTCTFDVFGPSMYYLDFRVQYKHAGGGTVEEGGGLGAKLPYHTAFIRPGWHTGHSYYTVPVVTWKKSGPEPAEPFPYSVIAGTPAATTLDASAVTATGATLNGSTFSNGNTGTSHFEWGTTTAYGTSTSNVALTTASTSASITGLTAGTTYHYRQVVTVGSDSYYGLDQVFTAFQMNNRWNIVSMPYSSYNDAPAQVFPTATGPIYGYNGGYNAASRIIPGVGYWAKFPSAQLVGFTGPTYATLYVPVKTGWNMIGGPSSNVAVASVVPSPGLTIGSFFGYSSGYAAAATLTPGQGYWVKASKDGSIALTVGAAKASKNELADLGKVTVTDAAGNTQVLYVGRSFASAAKYDMPPTAPEASFDARFANGRYAENVDNGATKVLPISISTSSYPVSISWDMKKDLSASIIVDGKASSVSGKGSVKITSESSVGLNVSAATMPVEFALSQNYPNPFNPSTQIKYALPSDAHVKLTVYNVLGQAVLNLVDGVQEAGYHAVDFNAASLSTGVYFYRLEAGTFSDIKKMMLVK